MPDETTDPRLSHDAPDSALALVAAHRNAAGLEHVARIVDALVVEVRGTTQAVSALTTELRAHAAAEHPLLVRHDQREEALAKARVDAEARVVAEAAVRAAQRAADEEKRKAELAAEEAARVLATKQAKTRAWQVATVVFGLAGIFAGELFREIFGDVAPETEVQDAGH